MSTNATITVGTVTQDDADAEFESDYTPGIFTDYFLTNRYEKDHHRYMMGITSPNGFQSQKAAFVQLAESTLLCITEWTACKVGTQPEIPDPETGTETDWVLLDEDYDLDMVNVMTDGDTLVYRITGYFVYGMRNPQDKTIKDVDYPRPPWLDVDPSEKVQPEDRLKKDLS